MVLLQALVHWFKNYRPSKAENSAKIKICKIKVNSPTVFVVKIAKSSFLIWEIVSHSQRVDLFYKGYLFWTWYQIKDGTLAFSPDTTITLILLGKEVSVLLEEDFSISQTKMRMRKSEMRMRESDEKTLALLVWIQLYRNVVGWHSHFCYTPCHCMISWCFPQLWSDIWM